MKKLFTILNLAIIGFSNIVTAQAPNYLWASGAGGSFNDQGRCVTTDAAGNVIVTGYFNSASITFGTITLTNPNPGIVGADVFIVKYDASGNVLWANSAGGTIDDYGRSVSTDSSGNIFLTGYFKSNTITFGTTTLTNAGFINIFIVKYDAGGNVLWAKSAGGIGNDFGQSVSTDVNGNAFMTGSFDSPSIVFGTDTLINTNNYWDIFIVKYDANGNELWAKSAGGIISDDGYSVCTDAGGNVFLTGQFQSPAITFGTTTLTNSYTGSSDIFISKFDASGNVLWAKSAGGTNNDYGYCVSTDTNGNVFMSGYFRSPIITFGTDTLTNAGYDDIFIAKYDASGNVLWAKSAGGAGYDGSASASTDVSGNVFMAGYFYSSSIIFGTDTLTNADSTFSDIFIAKYDAIGNVVWATSAGGSIYDGGNSICTGASGDAFMTGAFKSPVLAFGSTNLINAGNNDFFIVKLNETALGIEELSTHSDISVAPNPFTSETTITFNAEQKNTTIKITDVLGNVIKTTTFSGKQYKIEKGAMRTGIYLVQTIDETKNVANKKIVVQ